MQCPDLRHFMDTIATILGVIAAIVAVALFALIALVLSLDMLADRENKKTGEK